MPKRRRVDENLMAAGGGAVANIDERKRAIAIAIRERTKFPTRQFGTAHLTRGGDFTRREFGKSYAEASDLQKSNRRQYGYYGAGKYSVRRFTKDVRSLLGNRIISAANKRIVSGISGGGMYQGEGIYQGTGQYRNRGASRSYSAQMRAAASNSLVTSGALTHGPPARVTNTGNETGDIIITHTEYISDVYAPGIAGGDPVTFENRVYPINAGLQDTFQWLSQIAQNYSEYEFGQLVFQYKSTINADNASATGQNGTIIMTTDYNVNNAPFATKGEMLTYAHGASAIITQHQVHGVECDNRKVAESVFYVRSGTVPPGQDKRQYDKATFQLALEGVPAAFNGQNIGELWVYYTVRLSKPKLSTTRGRNIDEAWYLAKNIPTGQPPDIHRPFQHGYYSMINNSLSVRLQDLPDISAFNVIFPANLSGVYCVELQWSTNDTTSLIPQRYGLIAVEGNVQTRTVYLGSGAIATAVPDWQNGIVGVAYPTVTGGNLVRASTSFMLAIKPATQGINNLARFQCGDPNTQNANCNFLLKVTQCNDWGDLDKNTFPLFKDDASGRIVDWSARVYNYSGPNP